MLASSCVRGGRKKRQNLFSFKRGGFWGSSPSRRRVGEQGLSSYQGSDNKQPTKEILKRGYLANTGMRKNSITTSRKSEKTILRTQKKLLWRGEETAESCGRKGGEDEMRRWWSEARKLIATKELSN